MMLILSTFFLTIFIVLMKMCQLTRSMGVRITPGRVAGARDPLPARRHLARRVSKSQPAIVIRLRNHPY
jgi:hypothetical protein